MYNEKEIRKLQEDYVEGTVIEFDTVDAKYGVECGTKAAILGIKDNGTVYVLLQNGKLFAIENGAAAFHKYSTVDDCDITFEELDPETKYDLVYGECSNGTVLLSGVTEVAEFICKYGLSEDVAVYTVYDDEILSTFGIYLNRIADMAYREELVKVLVPMQQKIEAGCK